jgi:Cu2+-containing amine oxidase
MTTTEDTPATTSPEDTGTSPRHPLDPLTGAEIEAATSILKRDRNLADSARFVYVTLREPAKETVLNHQLGQIPDREAHIVLRERAERKTYEATVSITAGEVRHWAELPNVQPPVMLEEFLATEEAVRKDPRWQQAMRRRGVTDFDMVMIDPWSVGYNGPEDGADQGRFLRPLTWVRQGDPDDNGYARPVEGLIVRFDLDPDQRFPAGDYPNQHPGGDGLPAWTAADRPLENTDLVLWHTFTAHHVVRPEDWPVMPITTVGFKLRADGFFDGNPALDLPPAEHCHHEK